MRALVILLATAAVVLSGCSYEVRRPKGQTLADVAGAWVDRDEQPGRGASPGAGTAGLGSLFRPPPGARLPGLQPVAIAGAGAIGMASMTDNSVPLRQEDEDGNVILLIPGAQQLLHHVLATVAEGDTDLFVDQVLSEVTRQEFIDRDLDPAEAFRIIAEREQDVMRLYNAMPQGERTPGVYPRSIASGVMRVQLPAAMRPGLTWTGFDMRREGDHWRLRWFLGS